MKRGLVLLVFLLVIPLVSSNIDDFYCDGVLLGECNEFGNICAPGKNLFDDEEIELSASRNYLFFGKNCEDNRLLIGSDEIELLETSQRFITQFRNSDYYKGNVGTSCEKNYLGELVEKGFNFYHDSFSICDRPIDVSFFDVEINPETVDRGEEFRITMRLESDEPIDDMLLFVSKDEGGNDRINVDGGPAIDKKFYFTVEGALEDIDLEAEICEDISCEVKSKNFILGEDVYVDYIANVFSPDTEVKLIFPDRIIKEFTLPVAISTTQLGTHNLEITVSSKGFKTKTLKKQFGVIEKEPEIELKQICNYNDLCDLGENSRNCPQDCSPKNDNNLYIISALVILLVIAYLILRKK